MNQKPIILTVTFQAHPGKETELQEALAKVVTPTRQEAGCLFYELHIATDDPAKFLFYESWESKKHHAAHDKTAHIRNLLACLDELAFAPTEGSWENIGS